MKTIRYQLGIRELVFLMLCFFSLIASFQNSYAGPFTQGNIVVVRAGDGTFYAAGTSVKVFLDEYTPSGTLVQSIQLPTVINGTNKRFVLSNNATSEGALSLSINGQYLSLGGYDTSFGIASAVGLSGVARVVALVDNTGGINTSTTPNGGYSANNIRSVTTVDGTAFWTSGNGTATTGGVRYVVFGGGASVQLTTTPTNTRYINIFNSQLFISSSSGAFLGVSKVGTGIPTTSSQTTTNFVTQTGNSSYGFAISPDSSICYVADDGSLTTGVGGVQKWIHSGSSFLTYTLKTGLLKGPRGITVDFSGVNPVIYAVTDSIIYKTTDVGSSSSFSQIVTASANTVFRGIAFAPVSASPISKTNFISVMTPQYMAAGDASRLPTVFRATVQSLTPNTTYHYFVQGGLPSEIGTGNTGSGNPMLISSDGSTYTYTTTPNVGTAGNYSTFTTDGSGNYTGWFSFVSTGNLRFTQGYYILPVITTDNAGNGVMKYHYALNDSIKVLQFSTSAGANNGTGIYGISNASAKNIVALFDNTAGTYGPLSAVKPLAMTYVESEGINVSGAPQYYTDSVNGQPGRWGTIIPNNNSNGVQRIEQFSAVDGSSVNFNTDNDGVWPVGGSTVNPTGGLSGSIRIDNADSPLPVQLAAFNCTINKNSVKLVWQTAFELNNKGFQVERRLIGGSAPQWQQLFFVNGKGSTNQAQNYFFEDKNLNSGTYAYRLKQIDFNGNFEYFNLQNSVVIGKPSGFEVSQNFPNPFNPSTNISYSLSDDAKVQLRVYDVTGRLVKELLNANIEKGYHSVSFDGTNLASGIYFYQLIARGGGNTILFYKIMKMLLIK